MNMIGALLGGVLASGMGRHSCRICMLRLWCPTRDVPTVSQVVGVEELCARAGSLRQHTDPAVRELAEAVLELFTPRLWVLTGASPPPCPGCGWRFAASLRRGRFPLHGPRQQPCPGAMQPLDHLPAAP